MKNLAKRVVDRVFSRGFHKLLYTPVGIGRPMDLTVIAQFAASYESYVYMRDHFAAAPNFPNPDALLHHFAKNKVIDGYVLEFGVWSGRTINIMSGYREKAYGFDTFTGVDEGWMGDFNMKKFDVGGRLPKVNANVELVVGLFQDTLPAFVSRMTAPASLIHIDCDIYSSTKTALDVLAPRIVPGTVIVFDEYFNYYEWQKHEYKAFREFLDATGHKYEYAGFVSSSTQVAVRITS